MCIQSYNGVLFYESISLLAIIMAWHQGSKKLSALLGKPKRNLLLIASRSSKASRAREPVRRL